MFTPFLYNIGTVLLSYMKRLQDDGKVQRIRAGQDKGKYRKLE